MNIAIGADHGGYEYKEFIKKNVSNCTFIDVGARELNSTDDYTEFSFAVAEKVKDGQADLGIMICRTGVGAVVAMNKVCGIRAGVLETTKGVILARSKNDINCLSFGADNISKRRAKRIVELFMSTSFSGGRHERRVKQIVEYERGGYEKK